MMKKALKCWGLLALALGMGLASGTTAKAMTVPMGAQYSQQRANSVKLVWRRPMNRQAYHATGAGARYSKHLGIRYQAVMSTLTRFTFYTDAHEKVRVKATGKARIYYHIKTSDNLFGGWVWRGYLKIGVVPGLGTVGKPAALTGKLDLTSATSTAKFDRDVVAYEQQLRPDFKFDTKLDNYALLEAKNYNNRAFDSSPAAQQLVVTHHALEGSVAYITVPDFNQRLKRGTSYTSQVKNMAEIFDDVLPSSQSVALVGLGFYTQPDSKMTGNSATDYRAYYAVAYEDDNE